jgi:hypothetical protein
MRRTITVGPSEVRVEITGPFQVSPTDSPHMKLSATCGPVTRERTITVSAKIDYSSQELEKEVQRNAQLLAEEAAGYEHSRSLIEKFLNERSSDETIQLEEKKGATENEYREDQGSTGEGRD